MKVGFFTVVLFSTTPTIHFTNGFILYDHPISTDTTSEETTRGCHVIPSEWGKIHPQTDPGLETAV